MNQDLLLQVEYPGTESRILRAYAPARLRLTDAERVTLAEIGKRLGRKDLAKAFPVTRLARPNIVRIQAGRGLTVR